jgi:outer membrane protein insertion porin family
VQLRASFALACSLFATAFALATPGAARAETPVKVVVAVLPFEVHSAKPLAYLETSLADLLSTRLEASGRVDVVEAMTLREALIAHPGERTEDLVRRLARRVGADWVVVGSLTELAGQYSLDVRVTPVETRVATATMVLAAQGDDELLDRINELATEIVDVVAGPGSRERVAAVEVEGAPDEVAARAALRTRPGDVYDVESVRSDAERLSVLEGVARVSHESRRGPEGVTIVFRVVPSERLLPGPEAGAPGERIARVEVRGNRRIEEAVIRARIPLQAGDALNPALVSEAVREVYKLGFFRDVKVFLDRTPEGAVLAFAVEENPVVRQVTISGNDEIETDKIKDNLTLTAGSTLDQPLLFENLQRIEAIYRAEGFYLARVKHEIESLPGDAVAIHFEVTEGEKQKLREIEFIGNERFDDEELMEGFKTKTWAWHSLVTTYLNKSGTYSEPIFVQDLRKVNEKYLDAGYVQAEVGDPEVDATEDGLVVKVRIVEGDEFEVAKLGVTGDETVDVEKLRANLLLKEGEVFNRSALNQDVENLEHTYTDRGFYNAEVTPRTRVNETAKTVDVDFAVTKGDLYFLRELEVTGNTTTVDPVIRREMQVVEGELYNARAVDISKQRVEVLGFFEEVNIEPVATDYENELDLGIKVVERPTGSLSFGAGFSSRDGFILSGSVSQANLFGRGYGGQISADIGGYSDRFFVSFSDPYLFGSTFGGSIQLYRTTLEYEDFDLDSQGIELVVSHLLDLEGQTRGFVRYSYNDRTVDQDDEISASAMIFRQILSDSESTSMLGFGIRQDTRNDRIVPTAGHAYELALDFAGLGGFSKYARLEARAAWILGNPDWLPEWWPMRDTSTWNIGARFGWAEPLNDIGDFDFDVVDPAPGDIGPESQPLDEIDTDLELPLSERYFLGGLGAFQLRGFEGRSVGPRRAVLFKDQTARGHEFGTFTPVGVVPAHFPQTSNPCDDRNPAPGQPSFLGGDGDGKCNSLHDTHIDDFDDLDETDVIGGNKFFTGTIEYRFPISTEMGLVGIVFYDFGNAFAENEDMWEVDLWRHGVGVGALWFSPFGPLQAFVGFPLDKLPDEEGQVFEFSVGGQNF